MAHGTYIIAEAGVNHDGSEALAQKLIGIAAEAGADAVKFQLFNPSLLVTRSAATASYQSTNLNDQSISQHAMLSRLTLPKEAMARLARRCEEAGIDFLCTPFDHESLDFLINHTRMPALKLASGEVTNAPLLVAAARTGLPVILSTGMSNLQEVGAALALLHFGYRHAQGHPQDFAFAPGMQDALQGRVSLLHCVSQYPAPAEATNLRAMDTLKQRFGLPCGLSDHTKGIAVAIAAVARGAGIIEKHFTYDTQAKGPDHAASLAPAELAAMVAGIREVERALGDGVKACHPAEADTRALARRSVVANAPIARGERFSEENLCCKRPGSGAVAPRLLWELLGKAAKRDYAADDFIEISELQ